MKLKLLASVAAAGLFAAGAASAEPNGWYGAIDAGYHMIDDINAESSTTGANWNWEVNDGWAAFARLGYRFNPNWRVELEGGYRSGDIGTVRAVSGPQGLCNITPATGPCYSPEGDITSTTLMANVIYDFGSEGDALRTQLFANAARYRAAMTEAGFNLLPGEHPIIPVMLGDAKLAQDMAARMLELGVYVIGFSFPVVPRGQARIRTQMSAAHTFEQIDQTVAAFTTAGKELGVI